LKNSFHVPVYNAPHDYPRTSLILFAGCGWL
jgi:hypothetical protein